MKQCLSLSPPAAQLTARAVLLYLRDVSSHRSPSSDLSLVVAAPSAHVVPAIPLKPASRVFVVYPSLPAPFRERLRRIDPEVVQVGIVAFVTELCLLEPLRRELGPAVSHVLAAEDAKLEHLFWRELRSKLGIEVAANRLSQEIDIALLHQVVDYDWLIYLFVHNYETRDPTGLITSSSATTGVNDP